MAFRRSPVRSRSGPPTPSLRSVVGGRCPCSGTRRIASRSASGLDPVRPASPFGPLGRWRMLTVLRHAADRFALRQRARPGQAGFALRAARSLADADRAQAGRLRLGLALPARSRQPPRVGPHVSDRSARSNPRRRREFRPKGATCSSNLRHSGDPTLFRRRHAVPKASVVRPDR